MWNNKGADRKVKTHTEQTKKKCWRGAKAHNNKISYFKSSKGKAT